MRPKYLDRLNGPRSTARFTISADIARNVPLDAQFEPVLTEDGILLKFVGIVPRPAVGSPVTYDDMPAWAKESDAN